MKKRNMALAAVGGIVGVIIAPDWLPLTVPIAVALWIIIAGTILLALEEQRR